MDRDVDGEEARFDSRFLCNGYLKVECAQTMVRQTRNALVSLLVYHRH